MSHRMTASDLCRGYVLTGGRTARWARTALEQPQRPLAVTSSSIVSSVWTMCWRSRPVDLASSGFTYESVFDSRSKHRCRRWGWNTGTAADFPDPATPSNEVTMVHQPWAVTWAASDTATLTPKLPTITSSMTVPTWTPGETIPDGQWDANRSQDDGGQCELDGLMGFVVIGLPVMGLFVLCLYIWCCVRACRTRRREKRIVYVVDPAAFPTAYEMNARAQNG